MHKLVSALICVVMLSAVTGQAADGDGGYAGAFLQVPLGARAAALGGAYRSLADDGIGPLYNPAGTSSLRRPLMASSYRAMSLDRSLGYTAVIFPTKGNSVMGVHWLFAGSGSVQARDADGYPLGFDLSQNNHQFSILFAKLFERWLSVGVNISYLYGTMPEFSATSVGFDFGLVVMVDQFVDREKRDLMAVQDIRIGIVARNFGKKYKWNSGEYSKVHSTDEFGRDQEDKFPVDIGLGISARFLKRKLLLSSDLSKYQHQSVTLHAGSEYFLKPEFALRAGFSDGRLTAGTGYVFKVGKHQLAIDYAFSTAKVDEGSDHIFSFDLLY